MIIAEDSKIHLWIQDKSHLYITPGGDPVWICPVCGGGHHVYGIENLQPETRCEDCGLQIDGYKW